MSNLFRFSFSDQLIIGVWLLAITAYVAFSFLLNFYFNEEDHEMPLYYYLNNTIFFLIVTAFHCIVSFDW